MSAGPSVKVVYLSQYFPPEMGAPAARVHELSREWARQGLSVTVLTGMPNHPTGIVPRRYRGLLYCREELDGIDVCRAYVYATPNKGVYRRALNYISFLFASVFIGFFKLRKPDVIIATSPQLLAGLAGWALAALKRVPFVFEVRDLWPESIEAVGAVKNRALLAPLYALVNRLYRSAKHIVVVTDTMKETLVARGIPASKISVFKNGVDLDFFRPDAGAGDIRKVHRLNDDFVVLYIGTMGMAHGLEVVIAAARALKDEKVKFLLVGEGARKAHLKAAAAASPNVIIADGCPRKRVRDYILSADACLVHLRKSDLFETVLPSKMFEMMGCAKPILLGVNGEARRTLEQAQAGCWFPPEDGEALARETLRLRNDSALAARLGANGRRFAEANYSRSAIAGKYAELLREIA